ncbi:MAG TPA: hypothetical protein VI861_00535, partial [Rickettsiales bacterium]|nr:hypothetical protein [Rickettsiales bacterium]
MPPEPISDKDIFSSGKTISFFVTEQVSLKDVLIELGRVAKIDVDIDPNINGGVVISAKNRPLGEIIERITTLGKLRYSYKDGILRFERDTPYMKNYFVDYLVDGSNLWTEVESNVSNIMKSFPSDNSTSSNTANSENITVSSPIAQSTISSNKTAGIMSVFATKKQHEEIEKYLRDVEKHASAQVLIEAKVVEVALDDEYKTGIDWSLAKTSGSGNAALFGSTNSYKSGSALDLALKSGVGGVKKVLNGGSLALSISALEQFGTTRTLSSPRIHAINNQKATLNFTDKLVYFKIESDQSTTASTSSVTTSTITSTKIEENVGVELNMTPSINLETGEITLNIKPKITVHSDTVIDPASPTDDEGKVTIENKVPVIQTRELNTIAKIQSGNIIVIGGLMKEGTTNLDIGIPFLQRIPIFGYLFKSTSKTSEIVETVIFIKATIVNSSSQVGKVDRELEQKFDTNKRNFF